MNLLALELDQVLNIDEDDAIDECMSGGRQQNHNLQFPSTTKNMKQEPGTYFWVGLGIMIDHEDGRLCNIVDS